MGAAALLTLAGRGQPATSLSYATPALAAPISADVGALGARASVLTTYAGGSTVVEQSFCASTLGLSTSYNVFLPPDYAGSSRRYPVLYMLHGVAGDSSEWQSIGLLEAADRMIQRRRDPAVADRAAERRRELLGQPC